MVIKRAANPTSVAQGKGLFAQVVEVDNATVSKTVYISGQVAWNASGDVVGAGDLRAQFVQVYENLRSLVADAGGTLADVVQLRTYLTGRGCCRRSSRFATTSTPRSFPIGSTRPTPS